MSSTQILWPVLAQVFLTLMMYPVLAVRKARAVKAGTVNLRDVALDNRAWPADVLKASNNIANQFEAPVLFYVLCLLVYSTNSTSAVFVVLAWLYALSRYVHAYVHVGSNYVPLRLRLFLSGYVVLLVMLVLAAWNLLMIHI